MKIIPVKYIADSSEYFERIKDIEGAVYLDSCSENSSYGRYDIISAAPIETIISKNNETSIITKEQTKTITGNPFAILQKQLNKYQFADSTESPFSGGAIGFFSYDLCRTTENIPSITQDDIHLPLMYIGIYTWALVTDHHRKETKLITHKTDSETEEILRKLTTEITTRQETFTATNINWNQNYKDYRQALSKIKNYITNGDCYQVNYSQRISVDFSGSSWALYKQLRKHNPAPYSAYLKTEYGDILSSSPEQFLSVKDSLVTTKPIKGTIKRSKNAYIDQQLANTLRNSQKNQAENLMIVDLLRNDIGKAAEIGSIKVEKLFDIESFEGLHHLVSTITAKLPPKTNAVQLLKACFPGGSITGAPKIRAMEIIEELEKYRRNIYCGTIGYIGFNGNMDTNIAIRTSVINNNKLYYNAGGGIVADSDIEEEFKEMHTKTYVFISQIKNRTNTTKK
ncbi:MAG: aminodeoxychorismate synthase component I [Gammaproteobacteria bacterium]|nr:MAG: aminodeoxychorismate synthase component I [Gammaproteobacteria bacterium]